MRLLSTEEGLDPIHNRPTTSQARVCLALLPHTWGADIHTSFISCLGHDRIEGHRFPGTQMSCQELRGGVQMGYTGRRCPAQEVHRAVRRPPQLLCKLRERGQ